MQCDFAVYVYVNELLLGHGTMPCTALTQWSTIRSKNDVNNVGPHNNRIHSNMRRFIERGHLDLVEISSTW